MLFCVFKSLIGEFTARHPKHEWIDFYNHYKEGIISEKEMNPVQAKFHNVVPGGKMGCRLLAMIYYLNTSIKQMYLKQNKIIRILFSYGCTCSR